MKSSTIYQIVEDLTARIEALEAKISEKTEAPVAPAEETDATK